MNMIDRNVSYHDFVLDDGEAFISAGWAQSYVQAIEWAPGSSEGEMTRWDIG